MMHEKKIIAVLQKEMPYLRKHFGVSSLSLFGSYSKGEQRDSSDIDILVTFNRIVDLLEFIELENYLSDRLENKIDLVLKQSLKHQIRESVLAEAIPI